MEKVNYLEHHSDNYKWIVTGYRRNDKLYFGAIKDTKTTREYDWQWTPETGLHYFNQSLNQIPKYIQRYVWNILRRFQGEAI